MHLSNSSIQLAVLALAAATRLMPTTLSPECDAANRQAVTLLANERVGEAEVQLSQFLSKLGSSADEKLCLGVTLSNLTSALERQGKLDLAEQAAIRSINLLEEKLGPNAPGLLQALRLRTVIALERGQYSKADKLLSRAESLSKLTHLDIAVTKGLRGNLLVRAGHFVEAEAAFRQAIAEREQAGQGATPDIGPELGSLADLYLIERRVPEALVLLERELKISEAFPFDADTRIKMLLELAFAQSLHKDRKEAESYLRRALGLVDTLPPALRPGLGRSVYLHYSSFLSSTGRKREGKALAKQAYALFGPDSTTLVVGLDSLRATSTQR